VVRFQAFEQLQALGMSSAALGAEALETGHTDLGVKGLEVLSAGASSAEGQRVLEQNLLTRNDNLAIEAAKLLIAQRGTAPVAAQALEATNESLRKQAVTWLAAEYDKDPAAPGRLREALQSRYREIRIVAALELAAKKDSAAFDALVKMLADPQDAARQRQIIAALVKLGDPRTPDAFLDRVENDPTGTALVEELLRAAGDFRRPENAERLLGLMEKNPKWRNAAFNAVLVISGHDQKIEDVEDDRPDQSWLEKQHPRRDAILARLLEKTSGLGDAKLLPRLVPAARWAKGNEVEPALAALTNHSDDRLRQSVVEALGWRLRKRKGSPDALIKVLGHKDNITQFLAAEGLARAGRSEGLNVLLAAVDFLRDLSWRARAVRALGELADPRALDGLLKVANDNRHPAQDVAAEALGHLGRSEKAEEIFKLLERFGKENTRVAEKALRGLRWLNTRAGWQLIRQRAEELAFFYRPTAVDLLGYNDDPATRDLLLRLLAEDANWAVVLAALTGARRLWGKEALEPDYALLRNPQFRRAGDAEESLKRVCEKGEPAQVFAILPRATEEVKTQLATSLLNRPTLPVAEAEGAIGSGDERTAQLAAQILGRAGSQAVKAGPALQAALTTWLALWEERREKMARQHIRDERQGQIARITPCLQSLLWAAGRLGTAQPVILTAATARPDDRLYRPIRLEAVTALATGQMSEPVLAVLETAALGNDPEIRALAADAISHHAQKAAQLAEKLLSDRVSFNRLTGDATAVSGTLRTAASQVHYQGVALPQLIAQGDLAGLSTVVDNKKLPEATRLGAIEGLAKLATEAAEAKLVAIGTDEREDEELRKAAWRALRRSKRARQKAGASADVEA
jgi:ParB family chromosome partitioning protein